METMFDITLNKPEIKGNRIYFSWTPNRLFKTNSFWIEYADFSELDCSVESLSQMYAPVCFALGALGDGVIHLSAYVDEQVLFVWQSALSLLSKRVFKKSGIVRFANGKKESFGQSFTRGNKIAILFGGGIESLAVLSRVRKGSEPYCLISLGGSNWVGSNPELNKDKFLMDQRISRELNIPSVNIRTNFRDLTDRHIDRVFLKTGASFNNSVLFLPFAITSPIPVVERLGIGRIVNGNEKENDYSLGLYCFSGEFTGKLKNVSSLMEYCSMFNELWKVSVVKELYTKNKDLVKYQYSCYSNKGQRWCYRCEKCFRNYIFLKIFDIDLKEVDFDEKVLFSNMKYLLWRVREDIVSDGYKYHEYKEIRIEADKLKNNKTFLILTELFKFYNIRRCLYFFKKCWRKK